MYVERVRPYPQRSNGTQRTTPTSRTGDEGVQSGAGYGNGDEEGVTDKTDTHAPEKWNTAEI